MRHYQPTAVAGITYRPDPVEYHGKQERGYVYPGRPVVEGAWPFPRPEECGDDQPTRWIADRQILVCTGCGLDCT